MTDEEMRTAIAEACGWKRLTAYSGGAIWAGRWVAGHSSPVETASDIPDYLNDLNAMHEAEKALPFPSVERDLYFLHLAEICTGYRLPEFYSGVICATARQRAEAFLRTMGKWKEAR